MTIPYIKYLSLYYSLACPLEAPATHNIRLTCCQCWWNLINIGRHDLEEISCHSNSVLVTRNLPVVIFSVSWSPLHVIVLPLRLMGLIIVTVVLMNEPLIEET